MQENSSVNYEKSNKCDGCNGEGQHTESGALLYECVAYCEMYKKKVLESLKEMTGKTKW